MAAKKTKVAGLVLAIVSWLVLVRTGNDVVSAPYPKGFVYLQFLYPLVFAVAAFVVTGRELAQEGVRRWVSMTGRVVSVITGGVSALFLVLYVFDALSASV